jgi:hypothetical protein
MLKQFVASDHGSFRVEQRQEDVHGDRFEVSRAPGSLDATPGRADLQSPDLEIRALG